TSVQSHCIVVKQDVMVVKVVRMVNRKVIVLVLAVGFDGDDLVPIDLVARELRKPAVSKDVGVDGQPSLRDAPGPMRIEASQSGATFAGEHRKLRDRQPALLR